MDADLCIRCKACEKSCARSAEQRGEVQGGLDFYEAWALEESIRCSSTSGGVFSVLARDVLARGGIVYGVTMLARDEAAFIGVEKEEDLARLRGSKYMQATPSHVYRHLEDNLRKGRPVLFSGTPCQVRAMRSKFRYKRGNLLAVDVACFGVPSRAVLRSLIRYMEKSCGREVQGYLFRDPRSPWRGSSGRILFADGSETVCSGPGNLFLPAMVSTLGLNESCYNCNLSLTDRCGDISLGDFWGRREREDEADRLGVSCLICRTEHGRQALQRVESQLHLRPIPADEAVRDNGGLIPQQRPVPGCRDAFLKDCSRLPLDAVLHRYLIRNGRIRPHVMLGKHPFFLPHALYRMYEISFGLRGRLKALCIFRRKK